MSLFGVGSTRVTQIIGTANQVTINDTTATDISVFNGDRLAILFGNRSNKDFWVRPYPAAQDNIKQGIFIARGTQEPIRGLLTGKVSAIIEGTSPDQTIYVTEI